MEIPAVNLKAIVLVHWLLTIWGCMDYWLPQTYAWSNYTVFALGVWAIAQRDSVDAIFMVCSASARIPAPTSPLRRQTRRARTPTWLAGGPSPPLTDGLRGNLKQPVPLWKGDLPRFLLVCCSKESFSFQTTLSG
ncbi:type-1 angiotensin II receptor-associated protein isoform 2-T2 [Vipera latastei]